MRCKPYDNTRNKLLTGRMKIKGKEYTLDLIERSGEILLSKNNFNDVRNVINSIQNYAQAKYKLPNSIQLFSLEDARKFKNQGYKALFLNKKSFEQLEKYMDRYEEAKIKVQNQSKESPKFERDLAFFKQDLALLEQEERELDQFRDEVENNLDNFSPNIVKFNFKSVENINNNINKVNNWFKQLGNTDKFWNKVQQDLQIPKEQINLLKESKGDRIEEKLTDLLANYSYTIEINTAKTKEIEPTVVFGGRNFDPEEGPMDSSYLIGGETLDELVNTSYYSNLIVPGGTNYIENEIAAPDINPSIKGHAQFSTNNGIGWFRSDDATKREYTTKPGLKSQGTDDFFDMDFPDEVRYTHVPTKTRRILEVQSDLFQKGRNQDTIIKRTSVPEDVSRESLEKYKNEDLINSRKNNFLQLLNKDNNWVTFFVKSIIQDSTKKGYEKVLFPSGNTASKVEGHSTLEEFKKQKEDRIKELENNTIPEWNNKIGNIVPSEYFNMNMFNSLTKEEQNNLILKENEKLKKEIEGFNREINQLKQELQRVEKEGFGALKPIYNFYENTVTNILKKQGYNPTLITDEYGNTWNEISIQPNYEEAFNFSPVVTEEGKEFDTEDINDYKNAYVEYFTYKNALLNQNKKYLFDVSVEINKTDDPVKKAELIDIKQELRDAIYGNESKNIIGLINEMSELEENKRIYNDLLEKRDKLEISLKKLDKEGLDTSFVNEALKDVAIDLYKFKNENLTSILRANSLSDLSRAEKLIETNKLENLVKAKQIINFYISVNPNNQDVNNPYYSREELLSGKINSNIIQELYDISNKAASLRNKINNSSRKSIIDYINGLEYFTKANDNKPYTEEEIFNDKSGLLDISLIDQMVFNIQDNPFSKVQSILQTAIFKNVKDSLSLEEAKVKEITDELDEKNPLVVKELVKLGHTIGESDSKSLLDKIKYKTLGKLSEAPDFSIFKQISKNGLQKNTLVQRYSDKYTSFMKEVKNKKDRDLNNVLTGKDTNKTVEGVYRAYYNNIRQSSEIIKPHLMPEIVTDEKYKDLLDELTTKEVNDNYKNYIISKIGEQGYKDILEEQKKQLDNYILTKERRIQTARFNYALVEKLDPDEVSLADLPEDVQEDLANWEVDNNPFYNGLLFDENRRVRIGEGRFNNYELDYSLFLPRNKEVKLKYKKNYSDSVSHSLRLITAEETNVDTGYLDERYKYIEDNPVLYDFWKTSMKLSKYYQESLKSEELENWEDGDLPIDDKVFIDKFMETSDSISDKILMYISKFYRDTLKRIGTSISSTMDLPYSNYNYANTTLSVNDASLNVGNRTINNEIKLKEIQLRQYLESQDRKFKEVLFLETIPTDLKKEALFLYGTNSSKISKMSDSEVNAEFIDAFKLTGKQFKDLNNQPITRYSANILEILKDLHIQNAIKESKSDLGLTLLKSASLASGIIARKKNLDMIQFMVDAFNNIKVVESNSFGTILTNKLTGNKVIAGESRKRAVSQMESFVKNVLTLRSKGNDNSLLASKEKAENLEYGFFNKYILNNGKDLELIDELLQNRDISEEDKEQLLKIKLSKIRYFDSIKGLLRPTSAQFRFVSLGFKTISNFVNLFEGSKQLLIHDATGQDWEPGKITEALGIMKGAVLRNATQFIDKGLTNGKSVTPQATKARFIIDRLDFIEDASSLEAKALKKDTTTGIAKQALNAFNPYILIKKIEYVNQGSVALAMLMSEKIKDNKGNESSVWDALDNKGKLKPEFRYDENLINTWEKLNTQEALNFKAKLNSARNKTSGDYSQLGESQLNGHWSGKLILNFKKWMPKYIAQMYGNYRYDYDSGKYVKGRLKSLHPAELMLYRISSAARLKGFGLQTLFVIPLITMDFLSYTRDLDPNKPLLKQSVNRLQMLTKVALKTSVGLPINFISTGLFTNKPVINISNDKIFGKSLEQKLLNQGVKPEDIGNIKAIGVELGINMIVTGVLILLTGLLLTGDDDEDEEPEKHLGYTKKEWGTIMHNTLFPIIQQGEVFYSDPIKAFTTINSIPIYNYYEQLEKSAKSIDRVLRGQDRDYIARGRDAGKYKTTKLLSKLVPIPMRDLESRRYIKFEDYQVATQLTEDKDKLLDKNISNARSEIKNNLKKEITEDNIVSMYQEYGVEYDDVDKEGNLIPFKKLEKRLLNKIMRDKFPTPNKGDKEKAYEDLEKVIDGDLDEETWLNKYYDKDLD